MKLFNLVNKVPKSHKVTEEEIWEFCRNHVAPYAVPKFVEFRDEIPLTVTEELFKKVLRDEILKKLK